MPIGKNFYIAAFAGVLIVLLAGIAGAAEAVFYLYNIILVSLWAFDMYYTPKPRMLEISRHLETKLSLAAENQVKILVRNTSDHPLKVYVTDDVPFHFKHDLPMKPQLISPHSTAEFVYNITPLKRGEFTFDKIHVRYPGLLGFCRKKISISTAEKYKVYPNMKALSQYNISSLNKNLFIQGLRKIRTTSSTGEFESLREYNTSDDFRKINWKATARKNSLIVNTYQPEKNQHIFIFIDSSRVMNTEINNIKKLDYAINSAFLLTDYIIKGGDNVGLLVFDHRVRRYLKPGKGPAQFDLMAENLYNIEAPECSASYEEAIDFFNTKQKRRSLIFIFTELFNADEALRFAKAVRARLSKHLVFAITIKDPRIEEMAGMKASNTRDMFLKSAAVKTLQERKKIKSVLTSAGILNTDVSPDKLSLEVVGRYLDIKRSGIL